MRGKQCLAKGALAGAVGGALGTLVLNLFQKVALEGTRAARHKIPDGRRYNREQEQLLKTFERAHVKTAEVFTGHVSWAQRERTAMIVEYAFGIVCGAAYGALAEALPAVTAGSGSAYGAVLFTGASEVVLPAIGFVPSPAKRTATQHIGGLAGNVVYGVTTEAVRGLLRRLG